jgi:GT2 family glycosyltransferase
MPLKTHSAPIALSSNQAMSTPTRWEKVTHSVGWMVLVAFLVRFLWIVAAHTYRSHIGSFGFGWEVGRIAYSLANGRGFSAPFGGDTGPTAWVAPIYPWIVSLTFRAFGDYSRGAAFAVLTLNSLFAALTCWPIYRTARRVFGEQVAVWSGWTWALLPYIIFWAVRVYWDTSLTALLLTTLLMLTLEMDGDARWSSWFGYGLLWGVAALTNASVLSFLPFSGGWLVWQLRRRGKPFLAPAAVGAAVFWLTLMPWLVRNYEMFGRPVFIKDSFGLELRCGNNPIAEGVWVSEYHPSQSVVANAKFQGMGELAFVAEQGRLAREWIAENPRRFAELTMRRVIFYWDGLPRLNPVPGLAVIKNSLFLATSLLAWGGLLLAWKRRKCGVFLFASLLIFFPLVYYVCFPEPRYRHPIDPMLVILGVYLVSEARSGKERSDETGELTELTAGESREQYHTLSVIIPVYNERRTVMQLLQQVARQPLSLHKELIIVDDYSTDGTREFLSGTDLQKLLGGNGANTVKLVLHEKNKGKGAGVRTGLEQSSGELVLIQDADLEYDPRDYPMLVAPILEGHADAVFGNRFHDGPHRVPRFWRFMLNRVFSMVCNVLTGLSIHDVTACYKVFRRELFSRMQLRSDRFSLETEMTVKLAKMGVRIYEVPIVYHGRTYAEGKKISWTDGLAAFYHLIYYRLRD